MSMNNKTISPLSSYHMIFILLMTINIFISVAFARRAFVANLTHYQSTNSPYFDPTLSTQDLADIDLKSSISRALYLTANISSSSFQLTDIDSVVTPGQKNGFTVDLRVGTKEVQQFLYMDTGSNLIWINCWPCGLNVPEPIYSPNASKSYMIEDCFSDICTDSGAVRIVPCLRVCPYEVSYGGGGSTGGILARETFKFGTGNNEALHNLTFGCARYNKNMFMNGILGLGSLKLSLVSQYGSSKFAYCIGNISDRSSAYSTLVIGQNVKHWGVETPLFIEDKYYVNLESIKIGTTSLAFDPRIFRRNSSEYTGGMVIDTGSTLTHIPIKVLLAFEATIMELIEVELGLDIVRNDTIPYKHEEYETMRLCYNGVVTRDLVKYFRLTRNVDFPTVKLGFQGGMTMELSAENIFQQTFENTFCSVIVPSEALRTTISILGNWMQQRFYFAYHLDQSVLSFTPAKNCKLDVEKHYIHDEL